MFLPSYLRGRAFGAEYAEFEGSLQLLTSSHLRERDKMLLRPILWGRERVFGTDSFLAWPRRKMFPVFLWKKGRKRALILGVCCSHLQHVRELPEFASLMSLDRSKWPRCLLWHGWLPGLGGTGEGDRWASSFGDFACGELERCLGAYAVDFSGSWTPPEHWDADQGTRARRITCAHSLKNISSARHVTPGYSKLSFLVLDTSTDLDTFSTDADWNQTKPVRDSALGWTVWPSRRHHSTRRL